MDTYPGLTFKIVRNTASIVPSSITDPLMRGHFAMDFAQTLEARVQDAFPEASVTIYVSETATDQPAWVSDGDPRHLGALTKMADGIVNRMFFVLP